MEENKNITIRIATPQDASQYIKLRNKVWRFAYKHIFPVEVFDEMDSLAEKHIKAFPDIYYNDNSRLTYVADHNGKIVGILFGKMQSGYEHFANKNYSDLVALYVDMDYQGLGIASKFKTLFFDWAKDNGSQNLVIGVLKDNHSARKIYEKWGGNLDNYTQPFIRLGKPYDEVFYTYTLQ